MLTKEQNELLTRTGPGTPAGELFRRYWQPAALSEELPPGGPPLPVRIMSEDLVLFRDERGQPGLLGLHCSHRAADLSYGRLEDGGLRCLYHGWLYDTRGNCLEQPGEPAGSDFRSKIHHPAYPCQEVAGVILTYMGPGEPPLLPAYEFMTVSEEQRWVSKYYHECNYLQGNEGNLDPVHPLFLHRFLPGSRIWQERVPVAPGRVTSASLSAADEAIKPPLVEAEETPWGVRLCAFYDERATERLVRVSNFILPNKTAVWGGPMPVGDGYLLAWHVPIDDAHHWNYRLAFKRSGPLDRAHVRERAAVTSGDYHLIASQVNRYQQNREEMRSETYAGMGPVFIVQDAYAIETAGPVQDRTNEHLGSIDRGVAAARRVLVRAIRDVQEGSDPPHVARTPEENVLDDLFVGEEVVPEGVDWQGYSRQRAASRGRG
jgi:phthalate 4,5-dioxygenase